MTLDPIYLINLILCIIIVAFGSLSYTKKHEKWPLYISIAFGLFGLSHLLVLLGLKEALTIFLIVIRTIAYLLVVFTLYREAFKQQI